MTRPGFLAAAILLSLPAAAQQMQGMVHSRVPGMDHSQMQGGAPQGQRQRPQHHQRGGQQPRN